MALKYRSLGMTGVKVSELCFGTMNFADGTEEVEAERILSRFSDAGGNFVDTANIYAGGKSEEMLGRVLKRSSARDIFFIATKVGGRTGPGANDSGASRIHILREVESSLRRLQFDHVDLLQVHHPAPDVPIAETLSALDHLVQTGKVRYIGCSNFPAWTILDSMWASSTYRYVRFVSEQPPYNLLDRRIERELIPMAQTYGLSVNPWGPLAGGMLSGKYHRHKNAPAGSRYSNDEYRGTPIDNSIWTVLEELEKLAQSKSMTLSQLALAWVASRPGITSPIIGARTIEQLEDNLLAADTFLTDEDCSAIDKIIAPGTFVKDYYKMRNQPTARW